MNLAHILRIYIILSIVISYSFQTSIPEEDLEITSSNKELVEVFNWAKEKARFYVMTGKKGKVEVWERGEGHGNVDYMPSYWAGYPGRSAFYSRDFFHQIAGAHLLGLQRENYEMMYAFAASTDADKKWFPLWALNFDGSPYLLDFRGNNDFVREVPATFELVERAYELYLWTGDKRYIENDVLWNCYTKIVTDFISLHDLQIPNGVAEGTGKGIFDGAASYNEQHDKPLIESGDGIACQYKAFEAYSKMAILRGDKNLGKQFSQKAIELKNYFNNDWGIKNTETLNRGYLANGEPVDGWGKENSWFIPMKGISTGGSKRTLAYLDFINERLDSKDDIPDNIEAISYIPETYFLHHQNELGWKWMKHIMGNLKQDHSYKSATGRNGDYPEVSYVLIRNVVNDLLGVVPNAHDNSIVTISHLPNEIETLGVENIQFGSSIISVSHEGESSSKLEYLEGEGKLIWNARFIGSHDNVFINGKKKSCKQGVDYGKTYSYCKLKLKKGDVVTVSLSK